MTLNIVQLLSEKTWGPAGRYVVALGRRLMADGHSVAVVTRGPEAVDRHLGDAGFTPGRLSMHGLMSFLSPMVLARILNRMSAPIVLHVHDLKDAQTALRARYLMAEPSKVRVVASVHRAAPAKTDKAAFESYKELDAIIFDSVSARATFLSNGVRVDETKLHTVHPSVPLPSGEKAAKEGLTAVYIGPIAPGKGVDVLIEAMGRLADTDITLLVAGSGKGSDVMPIVRRSRALGIDKEHVKWLGDLDKEDSLLMKADIGVVPHSDTESFGLAGLEFMAAGVPTVCTSAAGVSELVTDGVDGLVVAPSDPEALARALRILVGDAARRRAMGEEAAKTLSGKCAYDVFYRKMLRIYEGSGGV